MLKWLPHLLATLMVVGAQAPAMSAAHAAEGVGSGHPPLRRAADTPYPPPGPPGGYRDAPGSTERAIASWTDAPRLPTRSACQGTGRVRSDVRGLGFLEYLRAYQDELAFETYRHAALSVPTLSWDVLP